MSGAPQFRVLFKYGRFCIPCGRLNGKDVGFDTVTQTLFNCAPQFGKTAGGVFAVFREQRGGAEIFEGDGQPETVDTFMCQLVQIGIGIVVHIVQKLIPVEGGALDGTEKAAGNALSDPRFFAERSQLQPGTAVA